MEGRAPTKRDFARKELVREELDDHAANDEVLLDLRVRRPRRLRAPGRDMCPRDHVSASIFSFTSTRQRASFAARLTERSGLRGTNLGRRSSTQAARELAVSRAPTCSGGEPS